MSDASIRNLAVGSEGFRVGRVLSKSLEILTGNLPKYLLFGAVIALPNLLYTLAGGNREAIIASTQGMNRPAMHGFSFVSIVSFLVLMVIFVVVFAVIQSAMIYGAFQDIRGRSFEVGASVRRGLNRFPAVVGASICAYIVVVIGFVFLIVPGLMVLTMFFVIIPVCVVESLGPIRSLGRSRALTRGHRWRILAIYLVPFFVIAIVGYFLPIIGFRIAGVAGFALAAFVIQAIGNSYQAIVNIMTYHDLRAVKEGMDIEQLAAVFD
jgi:hypothetical protein